MMNRGLFHAQLNTMESLLDQLNLLQERNRFPNYSGFGAALLSHEPYRRIWEICYAEQYFDFVLADFSLMLFRADFDANEFHYTYYESPHLIDSYEDFLVNDCGFTGDDLREIGDQFRPEYEQAISTMTQRKVITPVRYDYEPRLYKAGLHPASHLHIGHKSNIRLGTKLILRPLSFVMLICRQCYPDAWLKLSDHDDQYFLRRNVREHLKEIDEALWNAEDEWELILS